VALALGWRNFGAAIAIRVAGVDRRTGIKVAWLEIVLSHHD
jgi:hypothetical protein